jgi:cystathionine beta-lyase
MDFKTAPVIMDALARKAQNGLYGYTLCDETYLSAVVTWMRRQRDWPVEPEWVVPTYGTLQALTVALRAFTSAGEGVILQSPVYMLYREAIELNGRVVVKNPLVYQNGRYAIDFDQLEQCMAERSTRLMVLCNPHNPISKVWGREDLERLSALAAQYGVLVFSDEIFAELTFPGHTTIPYSTLAGARDHCIVSTSLGKTFNFTGFSHANMIIPNARIRQDFKRQRDIDHYGSIDPFVYAALCAAYQDGAEWVEAMLQYVYENIRLIQVFFHEHMPQVCLAEPEGTFVVWIDWRALGLDEDDLSDFLLNEAFLDLDPGNKYGSEGTGFSRMNVATPRAEIEKSLVRLLAAAQKRGFAF